MGVARPLCSLVEGIKSWHLSLHDPLQHQWQTPAVNLGSKLSLDDMNAFRS